MAERANILIEKGLEPTPPATTDDPRAPLETSLDAARAELARRRQQAPVAVDTSGLDAAKAELARRQRAAAPFELAPQGETLPAGAPREPLQGFDVGPLVRPVLGGPLQAAINLAGLPADLLTLGREGLTSAVESFSFPPGAPPGIERPTFAPLAPVPGGSADIGAATRRGLTAIGANPEDLLDPQGGAERFVQAVIREATGAALPIGAVAGLAKLATVSSRSIPAVSSLLGSRGATILDSLATADLAQLARLEALYGGAAGAGGEAARAVGGDSPGVLALGQLVGGLTPVALQTTARLMQRLPEALRRAQGDPEAVRREVEAVVMQTVRETPGAEARLQQAIATQQAIPALPLSLGQASGSETLLRTEQGLAQRVPGAAEARAQQQRQALTTLSDTAESRIEDIAQGADITDTQQALRRQRAQTEARLQAEDAQAHGAVDAASVQRQQVQQGVLSETERRTQQARDEAALVAQRAADQQRQQTERLRDVEAQVPPLSARVTAERQAILGEAAEQTTAAERTLEQAQQRLTAQQAQMQARLRQAQDEAEREVARLHGTGVAPEYLKAQVGEQLRRAVSEELARARSKGSAAFAAVDPAGEALGVIDDTYDALQRIASAAIENGQRPPEAVTRILKAIEARAAREKLQAPEFYPTAAQTEKLPDKDLELQSFIRRKGGIQSDEAELSGELQGVAGNRENRTTGLIRRNGLSLDHMAQEAAEAGFLDSADTIALIDALRESQRTGKVYSKYNSFMDDVLGEMFGETPETVASARGVALDPSDIARTPIQFMELHRLRSVLLTASRETNDPAVRRMLRDATAQIDRKMELVAEQSGDTGLLARYQAAREQWRTTVVPFYQPGPGAEILARQNGVYRVPNENVVERFWHGTGQGVQADAEAFTALLGQRQDAREALETFALHDLYLSTVRNGRMDLTAADRWAQRHATLLAMFPEVQARFATTQQLQQRVKEVELAATALEAEQATVLTAASQAATQARRSEQAVQRAVAPGARPVVPPDGRPLTPEQAAASVAQQRLAPATEAFTAAETDVETVRQQLRQTEQTTAAAVREAEQQALAAQRQEQAVQRAVQPGAAPAVPPGGRALTPEQQAAADAQARLVPLDAQAQQAQQALTQTRETQAALRARLDRHAAAQLLGDDPQQRLQAILGRSGIDQRRALLDIAAQVQHDPQAQRGLLRGLWQAYIDRLPLSQRRLPGSDLPAHDPARLKAFVDRFAPVLVRLGGASFPDDLRVIAQGLEMAKRQAPRGGTDLATTLTEPTRTQRVVQHGLPLVGAAATGIVSEAAQLPRVISLSGGMIGYLTGQGIRNWLERGGAARAALVETMLQEALFAPDIAQTLAAMRRPGAQPAQVQSRLYIHRLFLGQQGEGER